MDTMSTDRRGEAPSDLLSVLSPKACISDGAVVPIDLAACTLAKPPSALKGISRF